jgi:alkylation response protein AidB-like acyl-CoA dehydrogenase
MLALAVEQVKAKQPVTMARSYAHHPDAQRGVAEMVMGLEAIGAQLDAVTTDWSNGVQHPDWPIKIVSAKYNAVETAWKIADRALEVSGGFGMFKKSEMERLFRDARAGRFHPANASLAHELIGKLTLGINPDDPQRWG